MIDTTIVRAHQQAATGKGGAKRGFGAFPRRTEHKIHMLADALGRPLRFVVSTGQVHDCTQADRLLEDVETTHLIADKGYDSERVLEKIKELGASAVIPPKFYRKESTNESYTTSSNVLDALPPATIGRPCTPTLSCAWRLPSCSFDSIVDST
jgi:hypothetical protein